MAECKGTPWHKPEEFYELSIHGLNEEMEDFYKYMTPTREESLLRYESMTRIIRVIEVLWKEVVVQCFGSFKTNTYLPTSDIDLVVIGRWNYLPLMELEQHLLSLKQCIPQQIQVLDKASVPIIKMIDSKTGFRVNISFNSREVLKSVDLVAHFIQLFPTLKKLLFVVKQFLIQRDLNEVFKGGLSSYSVVLMVIHFFQTDETAHKEPNLGKLLMRFFELYGKKLNYNRVGLSIKEGRYVPKVELLKNMANGFQRFAPSLLCIEDPMKPSNNVSRNSYAIDRIRLEFTQALGALNAAMGAMGAMGEGEGSAHFGQTKTILGLILSIGDDVVDKRVSDTRKGCIYFKNRYHNKRLSNVKNYYNRNHFFQSPPSAP